MRAIFRALGFFGFIKCIFMAPFVEIAYMQFEKEQRKVAESMGLTLEEYWESLAIYRSADGKILTDESAIEFQRKKSEAKERAYGLEEIKKKYGYKDF